jgi:hypothetical protein
MRIHITISSEIELAIVPQPIMVLRGFIRIPLASLLRPLSAILTDCVLKRKVMRHLILMILPASHSGTAAQLPVLHTDITAADDLSFLVNLTPPEMLLRQGG